MFSSTKGKMENLLDSLKNNNVVKSDKVYNAMIQVDRGDFVNPEYAYVDSPQSIKYQATISAPHMHAYALEYLKDYLKPGNKALDVGFGSGYLPAAFSKMMEDNGLVLGIEHIQQLYKTGIENISKSHSNLIKEKKVILTEGDGRLGCKGYAPFDCIHVGAAADEIPQSLIEQLANGGRMMIPVGKQNEEQFIYLIDKDDNGQVTSNKILSVKYVPLTSVEKQLNFA